MAACSYCTKYFQPGNFNRFHAHVCSECRPAHRADLQRLRRLRAALKRNIAKSFKLNEKIRELESKVKKRYR